MSQIAKTIEAQKKENWTRPLLGTGPGGPAIHIANLYQCKLLLSSFFFQKEAFVELAGGSVAAKNRMLAFSAFSCCAFLHSIDNVLAIAARESRNAHAENRVTVYILWRSSFQLMKTFP